MFLAQQRRMPEAIAQLQEAVRLNPKSSYAHYYLGRPYFDTGDLESARRHYVETARLDPAAPVHNSLGVVYMRLGQNSEAVAEFNEALRLHPDDKTAAENLHFVEAGGRPASTPP